MSLFRVLLGLLVDHRLVQEYQQHSCAVRAVRFLPDGALAYSAAEDGHICVYDCNNSFAPVKIASSGFPTS